MLHFLIPELIPNYLSTPLRLIDYVSFRAGAAGLTALLLSFLFGPLTVRMLKRLNTVAAARYEGVLEESMIDHSKDKTPSMGGILIVGSIVASMLLWGNLANPLLIIFLATLLCFSLLGFLDDYAKVARKNRDGISARTKLLFQVLIALGALYFFREQGEYGDKLLSFYLPFLKNPVWVMPSIIAFAFGALVVVGSSNAVNLTDGKDGLAVGCTIFCTLAYTAFAYFTGHKIFAGYLNINYIPGAGEIAIFGGAIVGACIGFLWYNCHPASMFMGDTGSLALGGSIGLIAVLVKQEILLILVGWVFVMEAGSAFLQILSYKLFKKRIFLCTPIHHHFEKLGWPETQIVVRFWIIAGICALLGLATLKLR